MIRRNHRLALAASLAAALFLSSTPALSITIHALGDQDPVASGFNNGGGFASWTRGWRFAVAAPDIEVNGLGMRAPAAGDFIISLFEAATGTVLAQESVAHTAGDWQWSTLSSGVALSQGSEYIVALHSPNAGRYYYGRESTVGSSWFPSGDIEYVEMNYCNNCAPGTLPTSTLANYQYGVVDIAYTTIPEPNTALLMGIGLIGLVWSGGRSSPIA
jgi:hypothetical protein